MNRFAQFVVTLLFFASLSVQAQTRSITIGKVTYRGTVKDETDINPDGTVTVYHDISTFQYSLDTTGVTTEPIIFRDAILFVKGATFSYDQAFGVQQITTAPLSIAIQSGYPNLFPSVACAKLSGNILIQNCVSIAMQLVSLTGKNFSFLLANGESFCAFGVNNTYVTSGHKAALDPQCDSLGFCKGASAPIILRAAPAQSCL